MNVLGPPRLQDDDYVVFVESRPGGDMGDLDGRVAVVTGGTRGIGRGIAEAFVREGAQVVINGRSEEKGHKALAEIAAGDAVHFVAGDAKKRADCERAVDTAVERYGRLDILVNNVGGGENHAPV